MAYYPFATEYGAHYRLVGPDGSVATFNDVADPSYVGMLTDVTGLDSAEVRESASELTEADGGAHGLFYFGRRPITMTGKVIGHASVAERNLRMDRARRASLALRGNATLSWKPSTRRENLVRNPSLELNATDWTASATAPATISTALSRTTAIASSGAAAATAGFTTTASGQSFGILANNTTAARVPVVPGATLYATIAGRVDTAVSSIYGYIYWRGPTGSYIGATNFQTVANPALNTWVTLAGSGVAPAGAAAADVALWCTANAAVTLTMSADAAMLSRSAGSYFDGSTAGFYWQGDAHSTTSGDFIEMYTPVRRQQPFRETEGWNKAFQMALVSEFAYIYGNALKTTTGGVAAENRGNAPSYPILSLLNGGANPTISDGTRVLRTTGLTMAAGEQVDFDTLNHTAKFTAGARNGQSANRYIDWATTAWPFLAGLGTTQTFTPSTGTLVVSYRDAWA